MDLAKFIHELLLENDIVIVPGFGAFVSEYKPAEISEDSDEIKPPSKTVSFNPQIRNNDGLLVGYVAEKKRSSHFDALKKIEKDREEILYKLDKGEKVELDEVGVLCYGKDNIVEFSSLQDESMFLDSFGLEATAMSDIPEEQEDVVENVFHEEAGEGESELEAIEEESTQVEEIEEEAEVPVQREDTPMVEDEAIRVTEEEPKPEKETTPPVSVHEEPEKKKGWLWLLIILIPLLGVSIFLYLNGSFGTSDDSPAELPTEAPIQQELIASHTNDSTKIDSVAVSDLDTLKPAELEKDTVKAVLTNTPKYYLVGGSFSIEENAETYLKELKNKGFDAFHVGKKGRFFIVGIATYDTFGEADRAKKEYMRNNPGSEVWVYRK